MPSAASLKLESAFRELGIMANDETELKTAPTIGVATLGDIVSIAVGAERTVHKVHKDLLCHHSEYFRTAFNGRWKEADEGVVLDDIEPEVFNIFVHWLYTQSLPLDTDEIFTIAGARPNPLVMSPPVPLLLIKACAFGDRFLAPEFKKISHNCFVTIGGSPWYEHIRHAFDYLDENDLLLKYLVEAHCLTWYPEHDTEGNRELIQRKLLPNEFLVRVMIRNHELYLKAPSSQGMRTCSYHYHESEVERKRCPDYVELAEEVKVDSWEQAREDYSDW